MPFEQLTFDSLQEMDGGRPAQAFLKHVKRAVLDLMDRPGDKSAREITMVFKLTPITEDDGGMVSCVGAHGEFHFKSKVPEHKTKTYSFRTDTRGNLSFSSESPEEADQTTFDDVDPDTGRVDRKPR